MACTSVLHMLPTINLNRKSLNWTIEIENERSNTVLSKKFKPLKLSVP